MATESITQFAALNAGDVASNDLLPIVDVSDLTSPTGTTKKVLISSLQQGQNAFNGLFNVKSPAYGAVGNGVTEDYPAFLAAITAADAAGGGVVVMPIGVYLISTQIVLPAGVSLIGCGMGKDSASGSRIKWAGVGDFCLKVGDTAGTISYGNQIADFGINIVDASSHGIWFYGAVDCSPRRIYIEGQPGTTATIGVQYDGADSGEFFVLAQNIECNHVWKGFVHTTTGTTQPTQVLALNCSANCDDTAGSVGLEVQSVAGVGCGDGVTYVGGNLEHCKKGASLNGSGTTLQGVRFENPHGTSEDVVFETLARCNQVIGGANIYTITNVSGSYTNQVLAAPKDQSGVVSQTNMLDTTTIKALTVAQTIDGTPTLGATSNLVLTANGTSARYILSTLGATYAGKHVMQAGNGSAGAGGALNLYGHAHATHPGDVVAGISSSSGGKFRVNASALDGSTDFLVVDTSTGEVTQRCATSLLKTAVSLNNGAAANTGTLTNAPAAGNPTKWIPINDNGTTRYIPAW